MTIPSLLVVFAVSSSLFLFAFMLASFVATDDPDTWVAIFVSIVCGLLLTGLIDLSVTGNYNQSAEAVTNWRKAGEKGNMSADNDKVTLTWSLPPITDPLGKEYPRSESVQLSLQTAYLLGVISSPEFPEATQPPQNRWKLLMGSSLVLAALGVLGVPRMVLNRLDGTVRSGYCYADGRW